MAASEAMSGRGDRSVHRLSPPVGGTAHRADQLQTARIVGDRAFAETPTGIEVRTDVDGVTADLVSYTRLVHPPRAPPRAPPRTTRRRRGIVALDCVYERHTLPPAAPGRAGPGRHIALAPEDLAPHRPPYALLTWHPARRGYAVAADLLGDDQLERTAAFYAATL
ncbi:nuclear transport factor 2 family protein [Streptomyces olivaceoviridis]|uniref:Nuclear transport factor 2 family protein n=1 Tax=Streptomyces olivaceoviridis TaxID=1921 RepID=A0ABW7VK74_STROI|nr:nuclear transport factor 2 family protein [Streptomyces corchorusii]